MKFKSVLLFGAPGSGKGTQGKAIGCMPGFLHVSTGDLFRALDRNSDMGKVFVEYSSKGLLVPDEFTIKLFKQTMEQWAAAGKINPATDVLVMDGVPRNVKQAELLQDTVDVQKILLLDVTDMGKMIDRLKGRALKEKRVDDADEKVIRNRLEVYDRETRPVLDFYPPSLVAKVDALLSPMGVLAEMAKVLGPLKEKVERGGCCCCGR